MVENLSEMTTNLFEYHMKSVSKKVLAFSVTLLFHTEYHMIIAITIGLIRLIMQIVW